MFQELLMVRNQQIVNAALQFFYKKLDISKGEQEKITIKTVKRLAGADGTCKGNYDWPNNKLLSVDIVVKHHSSVLGMLDSLVHELVHAKQHLRGDFGFTHVDWKIPFLPFKFKRVAKTFKNQIMHDVDYFDQLCEQEAFNKSHEIMLEFCSLLNDTRTESNNNCSENKECNMQVENDVKNNDKQEFPRDFDLNFTDPHGDICQKMVEREQK